MVAADARTAITFALSPGEASDAKAGRELLGGIGPLPAPLHLIMDRAYEDDETRQLALDFGFIPVVPPKSNRLDPWQYDQAMYRKRNEIERLFRRLKGFRRIFSRFEKLDVLFLGFLSFALSSRRCVVLTRPRAPVRRSRPGLAATPRATTYGCKRHHSRRQCGHATKAASRLLQHSVSSSVLVPRRLPPSAKQRQTRAASQNRMPRVAYLSEARVFCASCASGPFRLRDRAFCNSVRARSFSPAPLRAMPR